MVIAGVMNGIQKTVPLSKRATSGFLTGCGDLKRFFITYNDCYNRNAVNKLQVDPTVLVCGLQRVNSSQPDDKSKYGNTRKE